MLHDRVEQGPLAALMGEEGVPGDDLRLLQHAQELRQQRRQRGHRDGRQGGEVPHPAEYRSPQRVQQPPRRDERDHDHPAGEVHREQPDQCDHRQRDPVAMPQRRGDQDERRNGEPVRRHVGHRGGVELDVRHGGERRRQRGGGGRGPAVRHCVHRSRSRFQVSTAAPTGNSQIAAASELRVYAVVGAGAGQLGQHGAQGVERRRIVERVVGLDVAQLAHVGRRGLPGVEDPSDGVGVPDGVPGARNGLPVRHAAPGRVPDGDGPEQHPGRHGERGSQRDGLTAARAEPGQQHPPPAPPPSPRAGPAARSARSTGCRGAEREDGQPTTP